jgi:hypothetical protein
MRCMGDLKIFLHNENVPTLLKAGLAHAQLETFILSSTAMAEWAAC